MTYTPQGWEDHNPSYPVSAARMLILEGGVESAHQMLGFNVTDYGAVGDGTTVNTTAIDGALSACDAAGGGIVYFPEGIYKTAGPHEIPLKTVVIGAGCGASQINHTGNNVLFTHIANDYNPNRSGISDLMIWTSGSATAGAAAGGISVEDSYGFFVERVSVGQVGADAYQAGFGLRIRNVTQWSEGIRCWDFHSKYNKDGIIFRREAAGSASFSFNTFARCSINVPANGHGVLFGSGTSGGLVYFNDFDINMWLEGNSASGVYVVAGCSVERSRWFVRGELGSGPPTGCFGILVEATGVIKGYGQAGIAAASNSGTVRIAQIDADGVFYPQGFKAGVYAGNGTPEGAVTAWKGALFLRLDGAAGSTHYAKTSGDDTNTGWTAVG